MSTENSLAHTKWECKYHIVFSMVMMNKYYGGNNETIHDQQPYGRIQK